MSVNAQLAQGTTLHISGTGGSAKNITGVSVGFPAIITSSAHGLANGDVVAIAAITGTIGTDSTNGLNGKSYVVKNVTTNTFAIEANTTGLAYTSGGTATPSAWTKLGEVKSINPSGATAPVSDVSDLDSTAKESRTGLKDNGTFTIDIFVLPTDAGQAAFLSAFSDSSSKTFKITVPAPSNTVLTFPGSVTQFPAIPDIAVDGVLMGSIGVKVGAITVS